MLAALNLIARMLSPGATAQTLHWAAVRFQHISVIRAQLMEKYAPSTVNKHLAAIRGVLRTAYNLGQLDNDDYRRALAVKSVFNDRLPAGRELTPGELASLVNACKADPEPAGARDAALLAVLYAGLRRSEVVALNRDHIGPDGQITVRAGKGRKDRIVYLPAGGIAAMNAWLAVRTDQAAPLFTRIGKGGRMSTDRMSDQAVYNILQRRAEQAGVEDLSPHDLRRTFVGDALDAGADLATVQRLAGHNDPKTTARYDRRPEAAKKRAAALLHFPF
ncbi:MAG: tyrosine-type recombinase/integrase [Chloroflexaceae bacterium]|nr:tyrosine-type recombinase/integrase [Chloroflexaceae bacterium]